MHVKKLHKQKAKIRFDKSVSEKIPEYKPGDKVYVKEFQIKGKAQNKFNGPFEVLEVFKALLRIVSLFQTVWAAVNCQMPIRFKAHKQYCRTILSRGKHH